SPLRPGSWRHRARLYGSVLEDRPNPHRRALRRARPRGVRGRLALPPQARMGDRAAAPRSRPQSGVLPMKKNIVRVLAAALLASAAGPMVAASASAQVGGVVQDPRNYSQN